MTTNWKLTAQEIAQDALEHLQVLFSGQSISTNDEAICLRALNGILKELPVRGLVWPKFSSGKKSLHWISARPSKVHLPDDYYGHAVIWRTNADGSLVELVSYSMAEWAAVPDTNKTAEYPTRYFIDSNDEDFLWPVPTANPTLKLKYQAITTDAASDSQPDLDQTWMQALGYGVASEVGLKMAAPAEVRLEVKIEWRDRRKLLLANSVDDAPIVFEVDD